MKRHLGLFALVVGIISAQAIAAQELPAPPDGFKWQRLGDVKVAFVMPVDWHYKEGSQGQTLGFFITRENIDTAGHHETGLSVNVVRNLQGQDAVEYAQAFVEGLSAQHELLDEWTTEVGVLKAFGCRTRNVADGEEEYFLMHTLAIGNERTNTLYIMWFESPEEMWESAWETGKTMLEMFVIDDEV